MKEVNFWAVVPAAGIGSRMGAAVPKQYLKLADATILDHTLEKLTYLHWLSGIMVAIHPEDRIWPTLRWSSHRLIEDCEGGKERVDSVYQALLALASRAEPDDWVLVHDVARPCVPIMDINRLKERVETLPTGGLLGAEVSDTLKRVTSDGYVEETVSRKGIWRALTPQMFRYRVLRSAIETALQQSEPVTDEASAVEFVGQEVVVVRGSPRNIKITTPEDLTLAQYFLTDEKPVC